MTLRPVAEDDLADLYRRLSDSASRGEWYPLPRTSEVALRRQYAETGFWRPDEGMFLIEDSSGRLIGNVDWTRLNGDVPDMEMGYWIFDAADRGAGYTSDAVRLMVRWLFDTQHLNRIRLNIHVDNLASIRVAEKCGFTREARSREAWFRAGKWHDVFVYTLTRGELARQSTAD